MTDELEMTTETSLSDEDVQDAQPPQSESMDESMAAVLAELEGSPESGEESDDEPKAARKDTSIDPSEAGRALANAKKGKKRQTVEAKELDLGRKPEAVQAQPAAPAKLPAPSKWPAEDKEWFEKQDPVVQKQALKWFQDKEAGVTKVIQELLPQQRKYAELDRIISHYAPILHKRGVTESQAVAEMFGTWHEAVTNAPKAVADLIKKTGAPLEEINKYLSGHVSQAPSQPSTALTPEQIQHMVAQGVQRTLAQQSQYSATQQAQMDVDSVRQSKDPITGSYLYPELHDDERQKGLAPLVQYERDTNPGISWAEATKRAIHFDRIRRGQVIPGQAPLGPKTSPEETAKVRNASVSLRGRGAPAPVIGRAKAGESVKESAEAVWDALMSNNTH